jgi:hypothetical protein
MRPHFIKTSVTLFLCAPFVASASLAADWNGSYSANGQCFCVGTIASAVENSIVPTLIGGQTVAQVCQRVGMGPGLKIADGLYSHPVYADSQCGHGPGLGSAGSTTSDSNCVGSLDGKGADSGSCQPLGPRWNIEQAFSTQKVTEEEKTAELNSDTKDVVKKQANPSVKRESSESLIDKPVVTSISVNRNNEVKESIQTLKATVISSTSTAGRKSPNREPLSSFSGKVITIDGKRYLQAREGFDAKGGLPGSRIIIDGSVFLLDDGNIEPTNLYRTRPAKKTSKKSSQPAKQNVADSTQKESVTSRTNQTSKRPAKPLLINQSERVGRNSVPRARPMPDENASTVPIKEFDASVRANERNQILRPTITQAAIKELNPVEDMAAIEKALSVPHLTPKVDPSEPLASVAIQSVDDTANIAQATVSQISTVTEDLRSAQSSSAESQIGSLSALKLPNSVHKETDRFSYIEAMPVSFDVGGPGLMLKGSSESHSKFHYVGRIGVTDTYQEAMLGGGYYLTPSSADRLTMVLQAGVEYGSFRLEDDQNSAITVNYNDTGLYFGAATQLVVNHRFELRGGLGYSTFFKGDLSIFGGAYWHMTPQLDLISQFELGDNDLVGLGIRFYY